MSTTSLATTLHAYLELVDQHSYGIKLVRLVWPVRHPVKLQLGRDGGVW